MLIEGIDYLIRLTGGLGPKVKGFVCEDTDGHYNIYVNKDHTREQQMQTSGTSWSIYRMRIWSPPPRLPAGGPTASV